MNSKPIILIAAAALISATACDRDVESTVQPQHVTFTLSFDGAAAPATRATYDGLTGVWEVGDEVYDEFASAGFCMADISRRYDKWHIDLPECNRSQLSAAGISDIRMTGICTYNNSADFFSARRLGVDSGRIFTGIILR